MKLLSRLGGTYRLAIHVVLLLACFAFLAPRVDAQVGILPLSPVVTITDTHLQAAINKTIGQSAVSPITTLQMAQLTSLDASGSLTTQIVSLSGLEHATNLSSLDLSANAITDVSPLRKLTKLRLLNLSNNSIASISNLSTLTNLTRLDLSDNSITSLTAIEGMTKLTHLYLGNNSLTSAGLASLRTLLGTENVSVYTDILVVKDVTFPNEPATSYGAGATVHIAVAFFNRGVRHVSTAEVGRVPADPGPEYYTGDKPYVALAFDGNALSVDGTKSYLHKAEWEWDDALQPRNTTVRFEYIVPQQASVNTLSINSLQVPADTRITHEYELVSDFTSLLVPPSDVIGLHKTVDLPSALPTGKPIRASGPLFPSGTRTADIPESTPASGDVLTLNATDPDPGDSVTYTITGGADKDKFTIVGDKLRLNNAMLDYESPTDVLSQLTDADGNPTSTNAAGNNEYVVVVQASTIGKPQETDLQRITVEITNVDPPAQPNAPTVTADDSTPLQLGVTWAAPTSTDAPITDYDVQYRVDGSTGNWLDASYTGTTPPNPPMTLTGLTQNTTYEVQVLAKNVEGNSPWSASGSATTAANSAPAFSSTAVTEPENYTGALVEHPIATDADSGDSVTYSQPSGTDGALFEISDNGQGGYELWFKNPPDYDTPGDQAHTATDPTTDAANNNIYIFYVKATSGSGQRQLSTTERFQVTVTDVGPPAKPDAPTLTADNSTPKELSVSWTAPTTNQYAPITDYDVQYRVDGSTGNWLDASYTGTTPPNPPMTLTGLTQNTTYEVQVLAKNVEGDSLWSNSGSATTAVNRAPVFGSYEVTVNENYTEELFGPPLATDADNDDTVTSYTLSGTDSDRFEIFDEDDGHELWFKEVPWGDYENPADKAHDDPDGPTEDDLANNNVYIFYVTATSALNTGRELSTTQRFKVTVDNVVEPPGKPKNLDASGRSARPDILIVTWEEGLPPVSGGTPTTPPPTIRYEVQYRQADGGEWSEDNVTYPDERTETGAEISRLQLNTLYDVQVQAVNAEDESAFSIKEDVRPANNDAPAFTAPQTRLFSVTENTPITTPITTFEATDADEEDAGVPVTYALGDTADEAAFELDIDTDAATAVLRFKAVPDFENPADLAFEDTSDSSRNNPAGDNVYIVAVTATSGERARQLTTTLWLTITVVDVIEYDNTPPVVQRLAFAAPPSAGYTQGSEIVIEVTFDDDGVDIPANLSRENRPFITLYLGEETAANRRRAYWKGRRDGNSTIVTFAYEVQDNDFATAVTVDKELGITVPPDAPIRNSAGTEAATTPVRDAGGPVAGQEQSRIEFPEVSGRQTGGGTQPGGVPQTSTPTTLTQEVPVTGTPVLIPETVDGKFAASSVPRTPLIFNEFGNGADATNDWLELRNVTGAAVSLKDWELSVVQNGEKQDVSLIVFPDVSVPANGLLLITHSRPDDTRLAAGDDIASDGKNGGLAHLTLVNSGLALPDDGKFLLILRNAQEKLGKNEAFVDVAGGGGSDTDAFIREQEGKYDTHVWPLQVLQAPGEDTAAALGSGKVWQRAKADVVGYHKDAWTEAAFTGLGYDRQVSKSAAFGGTPGYPNGAAKATATTPKGSVTISEIMVDSAGGTLPQWIELYNRSKTEVLNLNRWKLEIQNVDSEDLIGRPIVTLTLGEKLLQPNQTLLIVAGDARASSRAHLPADRIYNLFELHQKNLRVKTPRDTFLSTEGLYLKLTDRDGKLVDEIGNTDGDRRSDDAPAWALPLSYVEGSRSSIVRRYDKDVARNGKKRASWVLASRIRAIDGELYYGHAADLGTPGWRAGGALPVELSRFAVSRTDAGAVVLTWATESEVDNAGFNLRRSERRDGSFTLINAALIAGAGTTGERQTYTFTDMSAKPGVEYYYQLEEVSFAGKLQVLSTRLLRGPVSAANRQLRTFGEVKRQE